MSFNEKLKELSTLLDTHSNLIKKMEKEMRSMPLDIRIPFPEISNSAFLMWDSEKKRIIFQEENSRPLIECKVEIRIRSAEALERLQNEAKRVLDEFINRIHSEKKK